MEVNAHECWATVEDRLSSVRSVEIVKWSNQFSTCSHGAHSGLGSIHVSRVGRRLLQRATLTERSWRRQDAFANTRDGSAPPEPGRLRSMAPSVWRYAER